MEAHERTLKRWYKKGIYDIKKLKGECYRCKEKCLINPRTNKPYCQCDRHRKYSNNVSKIYKKCVRAVLGKKPSFRVYKSVNN